MKKVLVIIATILIILSLGFLTYNTVKYLEIKNKVQDVKANLNKLETKQDDNNKNYQAKEEEYENLKKEMEDKIKEYEKWQEKVGKIKENLE